MPEPDKPESFGHQGADNPSPESRKAIETIMQAAYDGMTRPKIVCLSGSSRWPRAFDYANLHESLMGHIVLGLGMHGHADMPPGAQFLTSDGDEDAERKQMLDQLHFRKIDVADEVLVVNLGCYIGSSTEKELVYAETTGKPWRFLFADPNEVAVRGHIRKLVRAQWPDEETLQLMEEEACTDRQTRQKLEEIHDEMRLAGIELL